MIDRCHQICQTNLVAVHRVLVAGSVDIKMMFWVGGAFRRARARSIEEFSSKVLSMLLENGIKDMQDKARGLSTLQ